MKRLIVAGGDGFIGWPLSLALSHEGFEVLIVDNLLRRDLVKQVGSDSLRPIQSPEIRLNAWKSIEPNAGPISFEKLDIAARPEMFSRLLSGFRPDAVVHLATIPSAPYSMKNTDTGKLTLQNNVTCTWAILNAIVENMPQVPVIHIGTMGVYGYDVEDYDIPEGYLNVEVTTRGGKKREGQILHPMKPGSLYHLTKAQDQLIFDYYNRLYKTRITDLHQGIVWGIDTDLTSRDVRLTTRLDYDSDFGTVLNRFAVQSAMGMPVTVYGSGAQKRAFIHLTDSIKCLMLAILNPPSNSERVRIFNQFAEVLSVKEIGELLHDLRGGSSRNIENPRIEKENNDLRATNERLQLLGWQPIKLSSKLLLEIVDVASRYKSKLDPMVVQPMSFWKKKT